MTKTIKDVAPWLSVAAIGGAIALAPFASAAPTAAPVPHNIVSADAAPSRRSGKTLWCRLVPIPRSRSPRATTTRTSDDSGTTNPAGGVDLPS